MVPSDAFSSTPLGGDGCCDGGTGVALGVAALFVSCPRAPAARVVSATNRKVSICFIIITLVRRSYSNTSHGISMRRKVVPNYLPVLHYKFNALQLGNVGNRISGNGYEIGKFPRLNRADAILPAQHFRDVGRNGTNNV